MDNLLKNARWHFEPGVKTVFINQNDIYQDGTLPAWRRADGTMWALSGHTHMGHIGVFSGRSLGEMREMYRLQTNFVTGRAGKAFDGVKYPEGVMPRGSIWPFGLWIHEPSNRFYAFFHNETGWNAGNTGYTAYQPDKGEPDFRHIGLMHSDDEGRTWDFDRWVITSNQICYTELFRPDGLKDGGQKPGVVCLGAGDFTLFVGPDEKYIYIFYTMLQYDMNIRKTVSFDVYAARTEMRQDGRIGDFVKYCDGRFDQPGNMGRETPLFLDGWHPHVVYCTAIDSYILSCTSMAEYKKGNDGLTIRTGKDLVNWSEPIYLKGEGDAFKKPYFSIMNGSDHGAHNTVSNSFSILVCNNGTDLIRFDTSFEL